jgi:hypothetical protein
MDDRLKDVQTSDLTNSRVNHEFVEWMKTKGINWLLAILLVVCGFLAWDIWKQKQADSRDLAWSDLDAATMPSTLEFSVAVDHAGVDAVADLALLQAADVYLGSVQSGIRPGMLATDEDSTLPESERPAMLDNADKLYAQVFESVNTSDGFSGKPIAMAALFGRAAVAESRGDLEAAKSALKNVARVAMPEYPIIADQAQTRMADLDSVTQAVALPTAASLLAQPTDTEPYTQPIIDDMLTTFEAEATPEPDAEPEPAPTPTP